jgi:hypothetical protein
MWYSVGSLSKDKLKDQHIVKMQGTTLLVDRFRPEGVRHQNKIMSIISTEVRNADHVTIDRGMLQFDWD